MSQIISITSEALQATIRRLLPSQQGFGEDLQASNVILPIVDLTPTAEGSSVPTYLQQALAFGSQTAFEVSNGQTQLAGSPGFYRVFGTVSIYMNTTSTISGFIQIQDGLATKRIYGMSVLDNTVGVLTSESFDFIAFLRAGDIMECLSTDSACKFVGSTRQVADVNGNLVSPNGFDPQ